MVTWLVWVLVGMLLTYAVDVSRYGDQDSACPARLTRA